jgi:hypothetical protein
MAIALVMEFPGGTQEQYEKVMDILGFKGPETWPRGSILHVAGPTAGGWKVVDVWESRKDFDRFVAEKLAGATQEAGLPRPVPEEFPVHYIMQVRNISGVRRGTRRKAA